MSINTATEIAAKRELSLEEKLSFHLALSFATPLNPFIIPSLLAAIDAVTSSDSDREIDLPEGVDFQGQPTAPARILFDEFQLRFFVADISEQVK
jgi:hypothetical protein